MNRQKFFTIIGATCGYLYFLKELESDTMGNIIFRNGTFSPNNIIKYMISPFIHSFLWKKELLSTNWIITVGIGVIIGNILGRLLS